MAGKRAPVLTEADIPPLPPPLPDAPERGSFGSQAAFDEAVAKHQAAAARREEQVQHRRRLKEKLREQNRGKRDRSGRDQSKRARPSDDGAKATERRRNNSEAAANHRGREAARYEAAQPEVTWADMALTSIVDAGESRPDWDFMKGAKVSVRARKKNAEIKEAEQEERMRASAAQAEAEAEAEARRRADPDEQAREAAREAARRAAAIKEREQECERTTKSFVESRCCDLMRLAHRADLDQHGELIKAWRGGGGGGGDRLADPAAAELDAARTRAGMYCEHPPEIIGKCFRCWTKPGTPRQEPHRPVLSAVRELGVCWSRAWGTHAIPNECYGFGPSVADRAMRWQCSRCCEELLAEARTRTAEWIAWERSGQRWREPEDERNKLGFGRWVRRWLDQRAPVDQAALIRTRLCEHDAQYVDYGECGAVLWSLVQRVERDVHAAAAKAARDEKMAAWAAQAPEREERAAAKLAAAGGRITAENARFFRPPKLFEQNEERDSYVHLTTMTNSQAWTTSDWGADSAPMLWLLQMTGRSTQMTSTGEPGERNIKEYDALVFEWHQLARLQPPTKYGADHRGRGARSLYALRQPLCPGEPPPAPPLSAAALKRKWTREAEAQLELRRREREREAIMARRADDPVRVRWEERQARQAAATPQPQADRESELEEDSDYDGE